MAPLANSRNGRRSTTYNRQRNPRPSGVRAIEYVQQTQYINVEELRSCLVDRVNRNQIVKYAYIVHDKDKQQNGEDVEPHIHCMIKLRNATRISAIATWFNCQPNTLQKITHAWQTALRYLTHMNSPDKHQYNATEVVCNFDYVRECEIRVNAMPSGRGAIPLETQDKLNRIDEGDINEKNWFLHFTQEEYMKYQTKIQRCLDLAKHRREFIALNSKNRCSDNIFIYGKSGLGKTRLAKRICMKNHKEYFMSGSGSDPLDGYKGEKAIIFDDIRAEDLTTAEYLKLTDPFNATPIKSRYKNVVNLAEQICMTTPHHPKEFCRRLQKTGNEEPKQFFRRHQTYIEVQEKIFRLFSYDAQKDVLIMYDEFDNIYESKRTGTTKSQKEQQIRLSNMMREFAEEGDSDYESTCCGDTPGCRSQLSQDTGYQSSVIQQCQHIDSPCSD